MSYYFFSSLIFSKLIFRWVFAPLCLVAAILNSLHKVFRLYLFFQEFERKLEEEKIRAIEAAMKEKEAEFKRQQEALRLQEEKLRKQKEWFEC